jgi:hypothetical protein
MNGPGLMLYIISAPITIAVTESPGIPSTSAGIHAPPTAALFALVGAITPSSHPVPNSSGFFDVRCATPYAANAAMSAPAPGSAPMNVPISDDLRTVHLFRQIVVASSFVLVLSVGDTAGADIVARA